MAIVSTELEVQDITTLPKRTASGIDPDTDFVLGVEENGTAYKADIEDLGQSIVQGAKSNLLGRNQTVASAFRMLREETNEKIKESYGAPLVATTILEMTDKKRVYVYTGDESGMLTNRWYYWNGSEWQVGGLYFSGVIATDDSLSMHNMPADAKAVGDALDEVNTELSSITDDVEQLQEDSSGYAASTSIAPEYSPSGIYAVGDYCMHDGALYRCTTAIATAEAWNASHWTADNVKNIADGLNGDVSDLKDDFSYTFDKDVNGVFSPILEVGDLDVVNGELVPKSRANFVRSKVGHEIHLNPGDTVTLETFTGYCYFLLAKYDNADVWATVGGMKTSSFTIEKSGLYAISARKNPADATIVYTDPSEFGTAIIFTNQESAISNVNKLYDVNKYFAVDNYLGKQTLILSSTFERGSYAADGATKLDNFTYRVRTVESISFPYDVTLIPNSGFRMYIFYIGGTNPGWENGEFTIPANQVFKAVIARVTEDTNEIADIMYFASQVKYITGESKRISDLEESVDVFNQYESDRFISSKNLITPFSNSVINSDTGAISSLDTGKRYASTKDMIPIDPSCVYKISWNEPTVKPTYAFLFEYTAGKAFIKRVSFSVFQYYSNYQYIPDDNTIAYVRIMLSGSTDTVYSDMIPSEMQFEKGTDITCYTKPKAIDPYIIDSDAHFKRLVEDKSLRYDFALPSYYTDNGYIQDKVTAINQYMDNCYANGDCFVFITDAHWEYNAKNSPALIRYLYDRTGISKIFDGGDVANGGNAEFMEYCQTQQAAIWGKVYFTVGNHEVFYDVTSSYISNRFDRHRDDYNGNPQQHYYYVDNKRAKIRYIVLACYEPGDGNNAFNGIGGNSAASQAQREWLRDVALDVENGWGCVIIMHSLYYVSNVDPYPLVVESRYASTIEIMDNFVSGGGNIICILQGHTHIDRMTHTPGGIPVFITCCDKWYDGETPPGILVPRPKGTIREQAFDVVCIDQTNRKVRLIRIGCPAQNGIDDNVGIEAEYRELTY